MLPSVRRNLFPEPRLENDSSSPVREESPLPELSPRTAKIVYSIDIYTPTKNSGNAELTEQYYEKTSFDVSIVEKCTNQSGKNKFFSKITVTIFLIYRLRQ